MFGQIEKEGLDQDLRGFGWRDYWDAVYLSEEEHLQSDEDIEDEDFDSAKVSNKVLEPHPLTPLIS